MLNITSSSISWKEDVTKFLKHAKSYLAVIFLQIVYAGSAIIAKAALNKGISHYAFAVYRNLFAVLAFAPFAIVLERKVRPRMTIPVLVKILLLGSLQPVLGLNLYFAGMKYTTATYATAMTNTLPAISFVLAWILRLEQVKIRSLYSHAKIAGTLVSVGGAMIMTLVKGATIGLPWTRNQTGVHSTTATHAQDPVKGAIMLLASCFFCASFCILQAITLKSYPAGLSLTSLICVAGAIESVVITLIAERGHPNIWSLHFDIVLLAYVYCGIMTTGVGFYISGVVMKARGPVFVTAFGPLCMIVVAFISSFILAEELNFGRIFGAIVIVLGLYFVLWGKSKDQISSSKSNNIDQIDLIEQQQSETNLTRNSLHNDCSCPMQPK